MKPFLNSQINKLLASREALARESWNYPDTTAPAAWHDAMLNIGQAIDNLASIDPEIAAELNSLGALGRLSEPAT